VDVHDTLRPAVFLDRDGTINEEIGYLHRPDDLAWIRGAQGAIRRLNIAGYLVLVVTNQAGVARGFYTEDDVRTLHRHMQRELADCDAWIDAFYYSPYHPEGTVPEYRRSSECRKPGCELFVRAMREWGIDAKRSFVIGDKQSDTEPGRQLGLRTILVQTGYGGSESADANADHVVSDIAAAVDLILDSLSASE
jgi:D-glycero-D-manno-heptose 1,7-bisphosphate phosphatase